VTPGALRILFLLPFAPRLEGRHGGARATGQVIAGLARRHQVAVVYLADPDEAPLEEELRDLCAVVEPVVRGRHRRRLRPKLALLRGIPTWASEVAEPRFAKRVRELSSEWAPDVVQVEFPVMGQYIRALEGPAPRVLVDHEASLRDLRTWHGPLAPLTRALDTRAWRRFERRVADQAQAVVVFTERDRRALESLGLHTPIATVPLGVPVPEQALDPVGKDPPGVLFVGSFGHPANVDAALWLAGELFPPVHELHPDARLTIVGPSPPREILALKGRGVSVTGEVPDVTPFLDDAAVVAAPLRIGGGMRVKVLEAMAAGKAVVATRLAVEGLDPEGASHLWTAEIAEEFRSALAVLLGDAAAREDLGTGARRWAEDNLGWDRSIALYEALYEQLLAPGRRR
jgi:polysaccharide biosynthesis protein PslH